MFRVLEIAQLDFPNVRDKAADDGGRDKMNH